MDKASQSLMQKYFSGERSPETLSALLASCREDPEVLRTLQLQQSVERLLPLALSQEEGLFSEEIRQRLQLDPHPSISQTVISQIRTEEEVTEELDTEVEGEKGAPSWAVPLALAACLAMALLLFSLNGKKASLGEVTALSGGAEGASISVGDSVKAGSLELSEGFTELRLKNGVTLTLEAPVTLEFLSEDLVYLHKGNVVAKVPENAIGFTVNTPNTEVVDLGTEFGVRLDGKGNSEVHVMEGEVKARTLGTETFSHLYKNDALIFKGQSTPEKIASRPELFLRTLPGQSAENPQFLHWSFDDQGKVAECRGTGISGAFYDGSLQATEGQEFPKRIQGAYGKGLYFNGVSAHVLTSYMGINGSSPRTVCFWAKVPKGFRRNNSYAMLGWGKMAPRSAWQISPNPVEEEGPLGHLRVGTHSSCVVGTTDLRDGQWHHIAVVMYGGELSNISTHVLMYIDGKLEPSSQKSVARINTAVNDERSHPLAFGQNLMQRSVEKPIKQGYFRGALDEVFIFDTALNASQIRSLMERNSL